MKTNDLQEEEKTMPRGPLPLAGFTQDRYSASQFPPLPDLPEPEPFPELPPREVLLPEKVQGEIQSIDGVPACQTAVWNIPAPASGPDVPRRRRLIREGCFETVRGFRAKITGSQENRLLDWLSHHTLDKVSKLVAAPPPEGFGMKVGLMTLSRLRHDLEGRRLACSFEETSEIVASLNHNADPSEMARTQQALLAMLTDLAFRMAHREPGRPDLTRIVDAISKLSSIVHARQRLVLQAARAAAGPRATPDRCATPVLPAEEVLPPVGDPAAPSAHAVALSRQTSGQPPAPEKRPETQA